MYLVTVHVAEACGSAVYVCQGSVCVYIATVGQIRSDQIGLSLPSPHASRCGMGIVHTLLTSRHRQKCVYLYSNSKRQGIVFSRRGLGGGVSIALFLSAGMLFSSSFFLTFGEAGHMPPILAAWATNIIFALVAIYLFNRRITGRPIYESIKKLIPGGK